ncbi:MAG: acyl-homoserine-lactone acylase [Enterobacterales bacterium]
MYKNNKLIRFSIVLNLVVLAACSDNQKQPEKVEAAVGYKAEIIRTSYGIPHITADDFGSLGFGEGFAAAEDHVCNIAHSIVVARGERTKFHGEGDKKKNLLSDIIIRALDIPSRAEGDFAAQSDENRQWVEGYAEGYNKYVRETGRDNITSWCKGETWVREITAADIFSRFQVLAQSGPRMSGMIASAQPPKQAEKEVAALSLSQASFSDEIDDLKSRYLGSNGWAFGKERTENGRGLLLGNPHYPWTGTNRFWEKHLTIPGKLNIYGVHLIGAPGVSIGFNDNVGWTHTVSNSERVVFYSLDLVPGDPTSYYYDGKPRKMHAKKVMVPLKDGSSKEHTVWFSHYGPLVNLPGAKWTDSFALTMRDANYQNQNLLSQWKAMDTAKDMDALKEAHNKWNAMPWVNTMATSKDGRAVFIDGSTVGHLSDEAIKLWRERTVSDPLTKAFFVKNELILLNGSDSRFEWQQHPESRLASVVPFSEKPQQDRTDYIFNANDSYWLTNVSEPLTGFSPLYGSDNSARSLRTRMNAKLVSDLSENGPAGKDGKFSLKEMQQALLSNRSLTAELLVDGLIAACSAEQSVMVAEAKVSLTEACEVLKGYDKHLNLDSKGAVLFREWITLYQYDETFKKGTLFNIPFDINDPVNTPRDLADKNIALEKLGQAVLNLISANLKLDSSLADAQFAYRGEKIIALHGGGSAEGIANIIGQRIYDAQAEQLTGNKIKGSKNLTDKGYVITFGASFVLSLSYTDAGPEAEAFLTYSQSGDPSSEHYSDQTVLFADKQWRPVLYNRDDILLDAKSTRVLTGAIR